MSNPVQALIAQAEEDLEAAQFNLHGGYVRTAVNRAYYAAFHIARAALLTLNISPKSHKGVKVMFDQHFIETGSVEREIGKILGYSESARLRADYDAFSVFDQRSAEDLVSDVTVFVKATKALCS